MRITSLSRSSLVAVLCGCVPAAVCAQGELKKAPKQPQKDPVEMVVRVYNVVDVAFTPKQYPYRATSVPTVQFGESKTLGAVQSGVPGNAQGGLVGGGGVGGGPENAPGSVLHQSTQLMAGITTIVDPESWSVSGGNGDIRSVGQVLLVRQTPATHEKIETLLRDIRKLGGAQRTFHIKATWFLLEAKQLTALQNALAAASTGTLDRKEIEALTLESKAFQGELSCLDGQTVAIVAGRARTALTGLQPVLANGAVAYEPVINNIQTGALLQVTPTGSANEKKVILDLHSVVSKPEVPGDALAAPRLQAGKKLQTPDGGAIDRVNLVVQQFATTLEAPLDRPVLVGGFTFDPEHSKDPAKPDSRLYLVVEVQTVTP